MSRFVALSRGALLVAVLALLAACGSVSGLTRTAGNKAVRIADFDRVEVLDFSVDRSDSVAGSDGADADNDTEDNSKQREQVDQARHDFADKIAAAILASGAFHDVARGEGDGPALRVTGVIRRYDEGNIVARGLTGFAGQSHFDASVIVSDARSGQPLATLSVDRHSWPLPIGASVSTLQTTNYFMNNAADKIAAELAARKRGGH